MDISSHNKIARTTCSRFYSVIKCPINHLTITDTDSDPDSGSDIYPFLKIVQQQPVIQSQEFSRKIHYKEVLAFLRLISKFESVPESVSGNVNQPLGWSIAAFCRATDNLLWTFGDICHGGNPFPDTVINPGSDHPKKGNCLSSFVSGSAADNVTMESSLCAFVRATSHNVKTVRRNVIASIVTERFGQEALRLSTNVFMDS